MIYGDSNRLDYPTCKVIETENFIIINGITYDKKTLAKLNNKPLEVGFFNVEDHNRNMALEVCHQVQPLRNQQYLYWYSNASEHEVPVHRATFTDSKNGEIEWTIHGDGIIKYNTTKKTYDVVRLSSTVFSQSPIYESFYLYQDDEWIYLGVKTGATSSQTTTNIIVVNKTSCEAKFASNVLLTGSYVVQAEILKRDNNNIYIFINDLGTHYLTKVTCAAGDITTSNIALTVAPDLGSYCGNLPSKLLNNNTNFYRLATNSSIGYYNLTASDLVEEVSKEEFLTSTKIKCKEFLKKKYSIEEDNWESEKTKYLTMNITTVGCYRNQRCYTMGDNDEFLVVFNGAGAQETTKDNAKNENIMVFKRNNPGTDPFDLTLVDYYLKSELYHADYKFGTILKLNPKTLYAWGSFGIMLLDLQPDGKLQPRYYYNTRMKTFGFDRLGRLYAANKDNNIVEMFTDKLPYSLEISYENDDDDYISFNKNPVTKNIKVKSKNIWGKPVIASFELGCTGKAEFSNSASSTYRGNTDDTGSATVGIKIKEPTIATVGKRLLYNNELQFIDESKS